jgi:hypothetical protein
LIEELKKHIEHFIKDPAIPSSIKKLEKLKEHSTENRHGSSDDKVYTQERLNAFVMAVELDKPDGWIFRWLGNANTSTVA